MYYVATLVLTEKGLLKTGGRCKIRREERTKDMIMYYGIIDDIDDCDSLCPEPKSVRDMVDKLVVIDAATTVSILCLPTEYDLKDIDAHCLEEILQNLEDKGFIKDYDIPDYLYPEEEEENLSAF